MITATRLLSAQVKGTARGATSEPRFCECDDGITRLIRWHKPGPKWLYNTSHGPKACFNEFVASRLGSLIGAPVERASVVHVPSDVISSLDARSGAIAGLHCGVRRMTGSDYAIKLPSGEHAYRDLDLIVNANQFAEAVVLMAWLRIEDHAMDVGTGADWDNSVFLETVGEGDAIRERYVLTDLENAFGTAEWSYREWDYRALPGPESSHPLPLHLAQALAKLDTTILAKAFQRPVTLSEAAVRECFSSCPEEWCALDERDRALDWTLVRARLLGRWCAMNGRIVEIWRDPCDRTARYP
jgi:hypothetical protein